MYKGVREFQAAVAPGLLLDVMWDFSRYPEFVTGVKRVEVLAQDDHRAEIDVTAGVGGLEFQYTLACARDERQVRWHRVRGAFKDAAGSLTHLGGERFRYEQSLDPGFAVPEFAVRFVLERSLPRLVRELQRRANEVAEARRQ